MGTDSAGAPGAPAQEQRFLPVALESLDFQELEMDLHLRTQPTGDPALYRAAGLPFKPTDAERLAEQGVKCMYIKVGQHAAYRRMLARKLEATVRDPALAHQERWKVIRASCDQMIKDVLLLPGQPEAIDAVGDVSRAFAEWSSDDKCGFTYMLDMSAHDYYTTSHMVNVGVGCGLLLKELKPADGALFPVLVQGGMLHDVGKRGVPVEVLNKEGKLDPTEWAQIQGHPVLGFEELARHTSLPPTIAAMARDHHERLDGKGYPSGLTADKIEFPARVCAVVDVYDAITAARPYRGPVAPADALGMMREGRGTQFDADVFDAWARVIERCIKEDPKRAVEKSAPGSVRPLNETIASPVAATIPSDSGEPVVDESTGNRRQHDRVAYRATLTAAFVRQGKRLPIKPGEAFKVQTTDLSRGGVGLCTPWPLSLADVLWMQFPAKGKSAVTRYVKVVRVRRCDDGTWLAGCCFIEKAAAAA